ncbi:phage integrase N-terminal domain-containing protein [Tahibacter soli]|uniref:Phage integrase N-terminal domain-containing protein n=1 Tax=Tahibacter soli TaxID=2983605 RepID=A0A9X4BKL7_9GAMM|nr:phage integrase N-terminal domain-containing protein [Tahibacter soli]MDC8015853.1 phage integrase N-terminal domain-containing protein [Tahibacter soli]
MKFELTKLCRRNRDGSKATQAGRLQMLRQVADELKALGFGRMGARSLKPKHVDALVHQWQIEGLAAGTRKNRMATLRWWAERVGKPAVIARDNAVYGIEAREFVAKGSKAIEATRDALASVEDTHIRLALRLQAAFGLRREEALKFRVVYADQGDHIRLRGSWCKGGRARTVPVRTPRQRALLAETQRVVGDGSLIPSHLRYVDQLQRFKFATSKAGISKTHGLRHHYAQWRYRNLTGWNAPAAGGPGVRQLSPEQRVVDRRARLQISAELGHGREQITTVYLGR